MRDRKITVDVVMGDGVVSLHYSGRSTVVVARILGRQLNEETGAETVWLDRLVHAPHEREFNGWWVRGAVSSILERVVPAGSV